MRFLYVKFCLKTKMPLNSKLIKKILKYKIFLFKDKNFLSFFAFFITIICLILSVFF